MNDNNPCAAVDPRFSRWQKRLSYFECLLSLFGESWSKFGKAGRLGRYLKFCRIFKDTLKEMDHAGGVAVASLMTRMCRVKDGIFRLNACMVDEMRQWVGKHEANRPVWGA